MASFTRIATIVGVTSSIVSSGAVSLRQDTSSMTRNEESARRALAGQSAAPAWPAQCNVTYLQFDSYRAFSYFADENRNCLEDFKACLQDGTHSDCKYACTADGDTMLNECAIAGDQGCSVTADNSKPLDSSVPPYSLKYAVCLPDAMSPDPGCHSDAQAGLTAYFKYALCGEGLYNSPDCIVNMNCAWDTYKPLDPNVWIWGTLGAIAAFGVITAGAVYYRRKVMEALGVDFTAGGEDDYEAAEEGEDVSGPPNRGAGPGAATFAAHAGDPPSHEDDPTRDTDRLMPGGAGGAARR